MIQVGQVLDKYELLERVGQGGMAIVYRGIDRQLKRVVAIKLLHKHLADYQEARRCILHELAEGPRACPFTLFTFGVTGIILLWNYGITVATFDCEE